MRIVPCHAVTLERALCVCESQAIRLNDHVDLSKTIPSQFSPRTTFFNAMLLPKPKHGELTSTSLWLLQLDRWECFLLSAHPFPSAISQSPLCHHLFVDKAVP